MTKRFLQVSRIQDSLVVSRLKRTSLCLFDLKVNNEQNKYRVKMFIKLLVVLSIHHSYLKKILP